jgi:hypothetical protein
VWREAGKTAAVHKALQRRLAELHQHKSPLVEAFLYRGVIDEGIYREQLAKLN